MKPCIFSEFSLQLSLKSIRRRAIGETAAQPVQSPAASQSYEKAMQTLFGDKSVRMVPELQKNIVQGVVGFAVLMQYALDDGAKRRFVSPIYFLNRIGIALYNRRHEIRVRHRFHCCHYFCVHGLFPFEKR